MPTLIATEPAAELEFDAENPDTYRRYEHVREARVDQALLIAEVETAIGRTLRGERAEAVIMTTELATGGWYILLRLRPDAPPLGDEEVAKLAEALEAHEAPSEPLTETQRLREALTAAATKGSWEEARVVIATAIQDAG